MSDRQPIREAVERAAADPAGNHSISTMAERAAMSPRHFARVFLHEMGTTPAKYVARIRLETARRRLEESQDALKDNLRKLRIRNR
jgi:transcriptional regulator GlxA family with amidase domain